MNDMDRQVRELLALQADTIPSHQEMPPSLPGRVRRRIAFNALAATVTVVVLAGGAFAGVRALGSTGPSVPLQSPTPSAPTGPTSSPSSQGVSRCTGGQLRAVASLQGAAGSREGDVEMTNLSDRTCTLRGTQAITLLDQNLTPITTGVTFRSGPSEWEVSASPRPPGWPVVRVTAGGVASFRVQWSNWCPQGRAIPLWRITFRGGGTVDVSGLDAGGAPPCNGPGQPSSITVGPFEPRPGS